MSRHPTPTELCDRLPDDAVAERWWVREHWPDGVRWPSCDSDDVQARPTRKPQPIPMRASSPHGNGLVETRCKAPLAGLIQFGRAGRD